MVVRAEPRREPRWRRRPESRPGEILEAALDVFGEAGLAGARLEEIAARAGVSKGTIYLYFANKDELFREMIRQHVGMAAAGLSEAIRGTSDPDVQLRRLIRRLWGYLRDPSFERVYRLVIGELHQFPDLARFYAREVSGQVSVVVEEVLQRGMRSGVFRRGDAGVAARMLVALLNKHAVWCGQRDLFAPLAGRTDEEVLEEVSDFYFQALRPEPSAGR